MDIGVERRGHVAALHFAHPALRVQDDDVGVVRPRKASMARQPVSPEVAPTMVVRAAALGQQWSMTPGQELHRHVLEGQRRPMEQLEQEVTGRDLDQRRHRGWRKSRRPRR